MPGKPVGDPRNGARYRAACAACLAASDLCWLCGHRDARTVDHVITVKEARKYPPGTFDVNHPSNLRPAHGTRGAAEPNPCPTCGILCNQARGSGETPPQPRSRDW